MVLVSSTLILCVLQSHAAITKTPIINDIYGSLLNNEVKYAPSVCCVIPTCQSPQRCYQQLSCGYLCSTGKYPPAAFSRTPGYKIKDAYSEYDCRFRECKVYYYDCFHCEDPRNADFTIYLVRRDCRNCYYI